MKNLEKGGAENPKIKIITFVELFKDYFSRLDSHTLESTQMGRLLQLIKASEVLNEIYKDWFI